MNTIQSIFGLQARQIVEPQYLDVKLFHDQTVLWRTRCRLLLVECRSTKRMLEQSRFLTERHYLNMELSGIHNNFKGLWQIYRTVSREAWRLDALYRKNLDRRLEVLCGKATA